MLKPNRDIIYVRSSVWPKCNLNCMYCPTSEGMENRVPEVLKGDELTTAQYLRNLLSIAKAGVGGISFTGGEPTLRADLGNIIRSIRPYFEQVELTTNGVKLAAVADTVKANVDLLKVSLDANDPQTVSQITGNKHAFSHAVEAIKWAVENSVPLGVNAVIMHSTLEKINKMIEYVRSLTRSASAPVHLSLLDFYYTPSRRMEWLQEFVPTNMVLEQLKGYFGDPNIQTRFGCRFYWFNAGGLRIRLKDSFSATMRANKCKKCLSYCQEGVYGVKHSMEGWFTTCPNNDQSKGVHLGRNLNDSELQKRIYLVIEDIRNAFIEIESFKNMCNFHSLPTKNS